MTDLIEIIPVLSDVASVPLVVISLVWLVNKVFDRLQEAAMINNDQINKLIGVMSEDNARVAELVAISQEQTKKMVEMSTSMTDVRLKVDALLEQQQRNQD